LAPTSAPLTALGVAWDYVSGKGESLTADFSNLRPQVDNTTQALDFLTGAAGNIADGLEGVDPSSFSQGMRDAEAATKALDSAYQLLTGQLDQQEAWDNFDAVMWNFHSAAERNEQETRAYIRALGANGRGA
jgi:hypothetical protein